MKDPFEDHRKASGVAIKLTEMLEADNTPPFISGLALIQSLASVIAAGSNGNKVRAEEGLETAYLLLRMYVLSIGKTIDEMFNQAEIDKPN